MTIEELTMVMDAVKSVTGGATQVAIAYLISTSLVPLLKYSIVGVSIYKVAKLFADKVEAK